MSTQQRGDVFRAECHPGECFKPVDSHSNLRNWVLDDSPISEFCFDRIGRGNPQGTQNEPGTWQKDAPVSTRASTVPHLEPSGLETSKGQ